MQNGTWQPMGVDCSNYNCVYNLQCHEGYDSTTGPVMVVCQNSGLWSAPNGTCQGMGVYKRPGFKNNGLNLG